MSPRRIALLLLALTLFGIAIGQASRPISLEDRRPPFITSTAPRG